MLVPYINHVEPSEMFRNFFLQPVAEVRFLESKEKIYGYWASDAWQDQTPHISSPFLTDFWPEEKALPANQDIILSYANKIFEGSRSLSDFEGKVLSQTLTRLAKRKPSRPNRN